MSAIPTQTRMNVPLLDLKAQYTDIRQDVDDAVRRVMESARFIGGPEVTGLEEEVARYWCERSGIPWLGRADIGHDIDNKIVPFGGSARPDA